MSEILTRGEFLVPGQSQPTKQLVLYRHVRVQNKDVFILIGLLGQEDISLKPDRIYLLCDKKDRACDVPLSGSYDKVIWEMYLNRKDDQKIAETVKNITVNDICILMFVDGKTLESIKKVHPLVDVNFEIPIEKS